MFRIIILTTLLQASFCQAEFIPMDDAELSQAAAQGSITLSIDAGINGASSEISFTPEGESTFAFSEVQTLSRNKASGAMDDTVRAPIDVVIDIVGDTGSGNPAIVAAINFDDAGASSTALKVGAWKLASSEATIGTAPSMGTLFLTDVTGSAIVTIGVR